MFHVEHPGSGTEENGMERRLGRGLDALLGGETAPELRAGQSSLPWAASLPIEGVRPNPFQPRKVFDSEGLEELRDSIRRHGLLQPICVRGAASGFEIVAGERRWRAARLAGLREIPAVVLEEVADGQMIELALVENVQRQDLDAIEKARAFREMVDRLGLTQEEVAERVGLQRSTVTNHLRLLELPTEVQEAVVAGDITMGHARALLPTATEDPEGLERLLARISREGLSVRQLERVIRGEGGARREPQARPPWELELEQRMRDRLGSRVTLRNGSGYRGQIVLHYHDREELDRLVEALAPLQEL